MKQTIEVSQACSWLEHRFNVVPWGPGAIHMPSQYVDSLDQALAVKAEMLTDGANEVKIYDTVDGVFHDENKA